MTDIVQSKTALMRETLDDGTTRMKDSDGLWYHFDTKGKAICGSKLRNKDRHCQKSPLKGRNRCKLHGGASVRGIAHPNFVHGKYSRDIIGQLAERYEEARNDTKLFEMRDDIALTEARQQEMLSRINSGENGQTWKDMQRIYKKVRKAGADSDQQAFVSNLNELGRLINSGVNEWREWDELYKVQNHKSRMIEAERKYLVSKEQMMTAEEAMALIAHIVSLIKKNIFTYVEKEPGNKLMAAISADVSGYIATRERKKNE